MKSCMRANPGCKSSYPDKGIFACEVSGLKSASRNHALFIRPVEEELCHPSRRKRYVSGLRELGRALFAKDYGSVEDVVPLRGFEVRRSQPSGYRSHFPELSRIEIADVGGAAHESPTFERRGRRYAPLPHRLPDHGVASRVGRESEGKGAAAEFAMDVRTERHHGFLTGNPTQILGGVIGGGPDDHLATGRQTRHPPLEIPVHGMIAIVETLDPRVFSGYFGHEVTNHGVPQAAEHQQVESRGRASGRRCGGFDLIHTAENQRLVPGTVRSIVRVLPKGVPLQDVETILLRLAVEILR